MNILLVCAAGMSTSLLVNRMNEAAAAKGIGINIEATSSWEYRSIWRCCRCDFIRPTGAL